MGYRKFVLCFAVFLCVLGANAGDIDTNDDIDADIQEAGFNIPGGKFLIDDEDELSDLTEKVTTNLAKISEKKNGTSLEFIRIHSAIYRVVAGFIYELEAEINENKTPVNCTISLWEKPWLDFEKFDVECGDDEKHKYQYLSQPDPDIEINTTKK